MSSSSNKKFELVARTLASEILANDIEPGSTIDVETVLMDRLDVSRSTLREGLRLLEMLGVVESRRGRTGGVVVHHPTPEHFARIITFFFQFAGCTYRDLLQMYAEISPIAIRRAAEHATVEAVDQLHQLMNEFDELPLDEQVRSVVRVTGHLHGMADNPILQLYMKSLYVVVIDHLELLLVAEDSWPAVVTGVRRIASAVAEGDAARAELLARAQSRAWSDIAERTQRSLLDSTITWSTA